MKRWYRWSLSGVVCGFGLLAAVGTMAHETARAVPRELVLLKGFRRSGGAAPAGAMTLRARGEDHPFAATERQVYVLAETEEGGARQVPDRVALEGPRELLERFTATRPAQAITILAERRASGTVLFLLSLDVCPPH